MCGYSNNFRPLLLNYILYISVFSVFVFSQQRILLAEECCEFFIEVNGDDSNTGTHDSPFVTLERAISAARLVHSFDSNKMVKIYLGAGTFNRQTPILLDEQDSHTQFIGIQDQTIISGGIEIVNWQRTPEKQKVQFPNSNDEIWRAPLVPINDAPLFSEQLFVNGRRASRSRFPNEGFLVPKSVWEEFPRGSSSSHTSTLQEIRAREGDLDELSLSNVPVEELRYAQFIIHHNWDTTRRIITGYDEDTLALKAYGEPMWTHNPWRDSSLYYLENLKTAFDLPGEWFYAGNEGYIYYRPLPNEDLETLKVIVPFPGLNQLLVISGNSRLVEDITFENLQFLYTDAPRRAAVMESTELPESIIGNPSKPGPSHFEPAQSASFTVGVLSVSNASNIKFDQCKVSHIGEYAVRLLNCSDCSITNSDFIDLGAGAIRIGGGKLDIRNKIENCIIREGGRFFASATGVWLGQNTEDISVLHNDIIDFYYTGISAGWVWGYSGGHAFRNRIEFNKIGQIGQGAMSDMGGVYTLGKSTGTRVCNNVIYDISSYAYGGWGLYPDEGSEGILFENNLVYDTTDGSFHQHYGKENIVRNNIFARSRVNPANKDALPHQIAVTRVEEHLSDTIENNIIYWKTGVALGYNADKANVIYRKNLWYNAGGEALFSGKTHDEWSKETGKDVDGLVADPLFVDPEHNDFHLFHNSPAFEMGFVSFQYEKAGARR